MKTKKTFTWADLKKVTNRVPKSLLHNPVIIWAEDGEKAFVAAGVEILKEDHLYDGDEGCAPKSVLKESIADAKLTGDEDEYYLIHQKGTRIIYTD
jgi:hypothetical protein